MEFIACGEDFAYLLTKKGRVWVCGNNGYGQLGNGTTNNLQKFEEIVELPSKQISICQISLGLEHSFILSNDRKTLSACG